MMLSRGCLRLHRIKYHKAKVATRGSLLCLPVETSEVGCLCRGDCGSQSYAWNVSLKSADSGVKGAI